jgi:carbonic anhydrase
MDSIQKLFLNNKKWAESMEIKFPGFFEKLAKQQSPEFLWIGCSDSRVPANEIVGLLPGELFVHRNVANLVIHTDINCLSVIQFAVDILKVKHVIVCGHYGCGGIMTSMKDNRNGLIDNWLRNIQDVYKANEEELNKIPDTNDRVDRLAELNVIRQVFNTADSTIIREAWKRGQEVYIHGWIYGISNGILKDLNCSLNSKSKSLQIGYLSYST